MTEEEKKQKEDDGNLLDFGALLKNKKQKQKELAKIKEVAQNGGVSALDNIDHLSEAQQRYPEEQKADSRAALH